MNFHLTKEQLAWQQEVRSFFEEVITPELLVEYAEHEDKEVGPLELEYRKKVAEKGWTGISWPKEYGGLEKTSVEQFIFNEELAYAGAPPIAGAGIMLVAPAIMRFGTQENKEMWLPLIVSGEADFALGYSEPNSGTDLASLRTTAILDGDEWVINGQKTWNTFGHRVPYQWAVVRTDPNAPKHKGLSIMIIPNDIEGVTLVEQKTWGEHRTNEVFFDHVRIPKNYLIGEENKGWYILTKALDHERIVMGSSARTKRLFDDLLNYCKHTVIDGELLINRPEIRLRFAELKTELEIARLFGYKAASMLDNGKDISAEASMMKVFATELQTKVSDNGMQIMELYGQLNKNDEDVPLKGRVEHIYRLAPFYRFGGGTNEIQRNIVAQRGLKLPRK